MILDIEKLLLQYNLKLKNVLHVGGHIGGEIPLYKNLNKDCVVDIFEPCPNTFSKLQQTASMYTNINCHNVALGSTQTTMSLYLETNNEGQSNSLLKPKLHTQQYPGIVFTNTINVPVTTLDSYNFDSSYNFLNIDVQGFELEVLKGSQQTLHNIEFILSEVNRAELYENCCLIDEIDTFLQTYSFHRVEINWIGNTWGDAFYIKK